MMLLTNIVLIVGVLAVVFSWLFAVRLLQNDALGAPAPTSDPSNHREQGVLVDANL